LFQLNHQPALQFGHGAIGESLTARAICTVLEECRQTAKCGIAALTEEWELTLANWLAVLKTSYPIFLNESPPLENISSPAVHFFLAGT
jgi:hypothetical protein